MENLHLFQVPGENLILLKSKSILILIIIITKILIIIIISSNSDQKTKTCVNQQKEMNLSASRIFRFSRPEIENKRKQKY